MAQATIERRLVDTNELLLTDYVGEGTLPLGKYAAEESFVNDGEQYVFGFWTVDGQPNAADPGATEIFIPEKRTIATKWYHQGGPGEPHVWFYSFSMFQNKFLKPSPIETVEPSESLTQSGNAVATSGAAVKVIAKDTLGDFAGSLPFHRWWWNETKIQVGIGNPVLKLPQNATGMAIAFFGMGLSDPRFGIVLREWATMSPLWRYAEKLAEKLDLVDPPPYELARMQFSPHSELARMQFQMDSQSQSLAKLVQRVEQLERRGPPGRGQAPTG